MSDRQVIQMHGQANAAAESADALHDGLDALFLASRQVEAAVHRERSQCERLTQENQALRQRYSQELSKAQATIRQLAARQEELRTQLAQSQQHRTLFEEKARALAAQSEALRSELARRERESKSSSEGLRAELETTRSALARAQEQNQKLEQALNSLRPRFESLVAESESDRREATERERRLQAAIHSYEGAQKNLLSKLAATREELLRANGELHHVRGSLESSEAHRRGAEAASARAEELRRQCENLAGANRSLNETLAQERQRRNEYARLAQAGQDERVSLRSQLQLAEQRLAQAEGQIAELSAQLLSAARTPAPPPPPPRAKPERQPSGAESAGPPIPDFLIDEIALIGYPIEPGS